VILFTSLACDTNYGKVVLRKNVQVYYLEPVTQQEAEALADLWEQRELSRGGKNYFQLSEKNGMLELKMTAKDTALLEEIPFAIQIELAKLDSLLNSGIFGEKEVVLYISDNRFMKSKRVF
jgi:hypothetical protein